MILPATKRVESRWPEGGSPRKEIAEMPENSGRLEAQIRAASGRSSKLIKDADGVEAVVEVPGRGTLTLSVQRGGGYSLRARPETDEWRDEAADHDLVAVGVLGAEGVVTVVPR
jgi:hypothetical protein